MSEIQKKQSLNSTGLGLYFVWLRGYAPNAVGDSLYLGLDGSVPDILTGFAPRQWSWANANSDGQNNSVTIEITESGIHTLYLWMREDGLRLDRILLTTDEAYSPPGQGPPESPIQ